jgi:hypothetical protein
MSDPRMSDKEMAAINAAAVTQEYRVKPHLGEYSSPCVSRLLIHVCRLQNCLRDQRVSTFYLLFLCTTNGSLSRPLVVLDNVKVSCGAAAGHLHY